ncbi:S8 family peptidase [Cellulomonas soli]|nr:S8 family serine peptidase [Cellulomonas soli]
MVGGVLALTCAASLTVGASAAVAADDLSDEGLWYYTATGIEQAHQTTTGEGVTVAVIDEGINPAVPELQGADLTVHEPSYCALERGGDLLPAAVTDESALHGTSMTSLIVGNGVGANGQRGVQGVAPGVRLLFYRSLAPACVQDSGYTSGDAIRQAVDDGADIINASWGSESVMADVAPGDIAYALAHDVIVVAAAPNASGPSLPTYPISYNGVVGVAAGRVDGQVSDLVVSADFVDVIAPGVDIRALTSEADWSVYELKSGTSGATAYTSGVLALVWSAYPQATANQILQSLIRNTGSEDHELGWVDLWGYGTVNVRHMLANDPTQYPDVNPLLSEDGSPSPADVDAAREVVTPTPSVTATQGASDAPSSPAVEADSGGGGLLVAGVGVLAVVLAGVVTALVIARRRRLAHDLPTSVDHPSTGA